MDLGGLDGEAEFADEIEGVIAGQAGEVEIFREDQGQQDGDRGRDLAAGEQGQLLGMERGRLGPARSQMIAIPAAHIPQHGHGQQRHQREDGDAALPMGHHDEGGQQRSDGGADIAADLKEGLRQAMPPARGQPRHPGGFGMEDGGAGADQGGGQQQQIEMVRHRQQQEAAEGGAHADGERKGLGMAVGVVPHHRLQDGGRHLEGQRDQADLHETELERALQQRIDRRQQRLDHVVEQMGEADGGQHRKDRAIRQA